MSDLIKKPFLLLFLIAMTACEFSTSTNKTDTAANQGETKKVITSEENKNQINEVLQDWHKAAAEADFDGYFDSFTKDGIFIGTDATENWTITEFQEFSKPYFDQGKAWDFSTLERNIFISQSGEMAWFDELLNTWMGISRGSGVLTKVNGEWKIQHYVLSVTVPNEDINKVIEAKKEKDSLLLSEFK